MVRQPDFRLRGAVEIEISGPGVERFMNLCAMEGIALRSVRLLSESRAVVVLPLTDFHLLRPLLRAANCRFHIRRRIGLPFFLARLRKRQGLALGALLCLAIFLFCNYLVFAVRIESPYSLSVEMREQLEAQAKAEGIQIGAFMPRLDFDAAEINFLRRFPNLMWVNIEKKGTTVQIDVVERSDIAEEDKPHSAGNIYAAKDGVLTDILVHRGTAMVEVGDTVQKGQLLVAGLDSVGNPVAASAIVRARTWYEGYGESPITRREFIYTGRTHRQIFLAWGGKERLVLCGGNEAPFENYSSVRQEHQLVLWRKSVLPVEVIIIDSSEQKEQIEELGATVAREYALRSAEKAALAELPLDAEILDRRVDYLDDGSGEIERVKLTVEVLENIATFKEAS